MKILHKNVNLQLRYRFVGKHFYSLILSAMLLAPLYSQAEMVTVDPILAGAIITQTSTLNGTYKERNKMREKILGAQSAIAVSLELIHDVEKTSLDYMRNASAAFKNLVQVKNIFESSTSLATNAWKLIEDIPQNLKGTAVTTLCYRKIEQTITDCTEMATLLSDLVTDTTYGGEKDGNNGGKKHVNLLNAAERYHILADVQFRLNKLNRDIRLLRYQLRTLEWSDIWRSLDYRSYLNAIVAKQHMNGIIKSWNKLKN